MKKVWKKMTKLLEDHSEYMWSEINNRLTESEVYKVIMHSWSHDISLIVLVV